MNIPKMVAKIRFAYHTNMLDVNNVLNQLKMRSDEKAEERGKHHCMEAFDCLERLGYDVYGTIKKEEP